MRIAFQSHHGLILTGKPADMPFHPHTISIPPWSYFNLTLLLFQWTCGFIFQSHHGLILTSFLPKWNSNNNVISIPPWSYFNATWNAGVIADGTTIFQSHHGLILTMRIRSDCLLLLSHFNPTMVLF